MIENANKIDKNWSIYCAHFIWSTVQSLNFCQDFLIGDFQARFPPLRFLCILYKHFLLTVTLHLYLSHVHMYVCTYKTNQTIKEV